MFTLTINVGELKQAISVQIMRLLQEFEPHFILSETKENKKGVFFYVDFQELTRPGGFVEFCNVLLIGTSQL